MQIKKMVESEREKIVELLRDLIKINSVSGNEKTIIDFLKNEMNEIGFNEMYIDKMGNLIGKIGTGSKILAIDAHVDTVGIGDEKNWLYDPFQGKIENGRIFGRGACDQKGGLASALYSLKLLKKLSMPKNLTIYFIATIQEEPFEGANWQFIIEEDKIKPSIVLLTEPSNLAISIGHRGRMDIKIRVKGKSSHGSEPDLGDNAIYKIAPIIKEVKALHHNLSEDKIFGKATITITDIQSTSVSLNAVADSCTIHLDRRLLPNETLESVLEEIKSLPAVKKSSAEVFIPEYQVTTYNNYSMKIQPFYPGWKMEDKDSLVQIAKIAYKNQFNESPTLKHWRFSTNGTTTKGHFNIPTIGFGPGEEKYAHTSEEQVPIEHLIKATEFYLSFIIQYSMKKTD